MALREILAKFGFDIDDSKLKKATKDTDQLKGGLEKIGKLLAAGFVISSVKNFISEMSDMNSQLDNTSTALGISYQDLQRWNTAAKYVDVSAEQVATAMKVLQKNAADAGGEGAKVFKDLGVDVRDATGQIKPVGPLMKEAGLAIANMSDPAERTAAVLKVFGKQGLALVPLFSQGAEGLDKLLGKLDELGGGIGPDAAKALSEIEEKGKDLDVAFLSLKAAVAAGFLPALTGMVAQITKGVVWFKKLTGDGHTVRAMILTLTGAILIFKGEAIAAGLRTAAAWAPLVIALALAFLLVDDLITALKGGDSVVTRVLDKILGEGAGESIFKKINEDWDAMVKDMAKTEDPTVEFFSQVGASLTKFVVEDIPEFASRLLFGTANGFTNVGNMITSQSSAWLQKLNAEIANIPTAMVQLGKDMLQSLADGIRSAFSVVEGSITDLAGAIKAKLKGVFDWHSPIPLFVDLGEDMAGGVPKGLAMGQQGVESAISRFAGGIGGAVQGASGGRGPVNIQSQVNVQVQAGTGLGGLRDAVREGATAGLGDLNAELAALEAIG